VVLTSETLGLGILGALSAEASTVLVTAAVALVASLQVATFRKVGDTPYSATLTTSNLRNLVSGVFAWLVEHNSAAGRDTLRLGGALPPLPPERHSARSLPDTSARRRAGSPLVR
jgi:uncharacterized membrane protein YoaK (UPF0700 family)